jgi:uncharacterized membrane protein YbhN (UPF0104 family)
VRVGEGLEGGVTNSQQRFSARAAWAWTGPALSVVTGGAVLAVLAGRLGAGPFLQGVSRATLPALALALALGAATTVLSAVRWVRAARLLGLPLPTSRAVSDYYAALFLNAVLPGGVLGDVRRAALHGRDAGRIRAATGALLVERSAGQLVLVVVAAAVWLVDPAVVPRPAPAGRVVALVLGAAAVGVAVRMARAVPSIQVHDVAAILGASAVVLCGHVAMFVLAARTAGVRSSVLALLPLALVALLAMSVPFNLAGWGPREGATAWAFAGAGLGPEQGVRVAVLYGLFVLVAGLPGVVVLLGRRSAPTGGRLGRPLGRLLEAGGQPVAQQDQVVEPADVGQHGAPAVLRGQPPRARQARRTRLAHDEGRDRDLQLVDDAGVQEGAQDDLATLDEQAADAAVVQVGQH